jgi:glycerol uptake facilitator-like aquaporin
MSKRRVAMYILAQLLASIVAISLAASLFDLDSSDNDVKYNSYSELYHFTSHGDDDRKHNTSYRDSKVFGTEFVTTFLFTYVIFTAAFEGKLDIIIMINIVKLLLL